MISYKCEKVRIKVILNEESYTSKCSFLDKAFPKVFNNGIESVVVHPVIVKL